MAVTPDGTVPAAELMTVPPVTVSPATTVQEAARAMCRHDVNQLPVTDGLTGRLVGIVSRADLLGVYTRPDADIQGDIVTEVFADRFRLDPGRFDVLVDRDAWPCRAPSSAGRRSRRSCTP